MRSRSASQPDLRAITFLRPSERRFSSTVDYDSRDKGSESSLRRTVFKTVHRRVLEQNSNGNWLSPGLVDFCLPESELEYVEIWLKLIQDPMLVSDEDLCQIFKLQELYNAPRHLAMGTTAFYIRSFELFASELQYIIDQWLKDNVVFPEVTTWLITLQKLAATDRVYVRYVGTSDRYSGHARHVQDLNLRHNGLFKAFSEVLRSISSQLLNSYKVYHFTNVQPPFDPPKAKENKTHDSFFKELREQALIALMGFPSLLNRQMSRSYPDFWPDHTYRENFISLNTNVLTNLPKLVQPTPAEMARELRQWAENIRMYALKNPRSTGTGELGIPSSFCERLIKQAKPAALGKGSLLAIVGSGAGIQGYLGPDAFFQAPGRSAHLFKQTLARLCAWENETDIFSMEPIDACIMSGALPFIDLCPWLRAEGQDLASATSFLGDYLRIA